MGKPEIERRFFVKKLDLSFLHNYFEHALTLKQGYFELLDPLTSLRIRITEKNFAEQMAEICTKKGSGLMRDENEYPVDLLLGEALLEICHHQLEKTRLKVDGWEIDFFADPLAGVIFAEKEMESENEEVVLPSWIKDAVEITDRLTNLHMARLASELRGTNVMANLDHVTNQIGIPRIALIGPPCSGKSGIIKLLKQERPDVNFVPEVASIVMSQLGIKPSEDPVINRRFQETIYRTQKLFEATSVQFARTEGKDAIIMDRGTIDNAAYFQGGLAEFLSFLRTSLANEYSRYDAVMYLDIPPKNIFEKERENNPSRYEKDYAEIEDRHAKLLRLWSEHPQFYYIRNGNDWNEKVEIARAVLKKIISNHRSNNAK